MRKPYGSDTGYSDYGDTDYGNQKNKQKGKPGNLNRRQNRAEVPAGSTNGNAVIREGSGGQLRDHTNSTIR